MRVGFRFLAGVVVVAALAACGGGGGGGSSGGGSTTVASTNPFNVRSGLALLANTGFTKTFTISGSCTGTFTLTDTAASTSVTFESTPAFSANETATLSLFGCTGSGTSNSVRYYNTSYMPVGTSSSSSYGVISITTPLPTAAHVGDTAGYGNVSLYSDSTKTTFTGSQVLSYSINADTASTAILNLITKSYNASSVLTSTEQDYYRISATGTLTPIALDIQYANGSTVHIVGN